MAADDIVYTEEPVRGHLFVGAITEGMIEAGAAALCLEHGAECPDIHRNRKLAEMVLRGALASPSNHPKEDQ